MGVVFMCGKKGTIESIGSLNVDITTKGQVVNIPQGMHDGTGQVKISTAEQNKIISSNIKNGVSILGVAGEIGGPNYASAGECTVFYKATAGGLALDSWAKDYEVTINKTGVYNVSFVAAGMWNNSYSYKIYKNGTAITAEQTIYGSGNPSYPSTKLFRFDGLSFSQGDKLQVYGKRSSGGLQGLSMTDFRISIAFGDIPGRPTE